MSNYSHYFIYGFAGSNKLQVNCTYRWHYRSLYPSVKDMITITYYFKCSWYVRNDKLKLEFYPRNLTILTPYFTLTFVIRDYHIKSMCN